MGRARSRRAPSLVQKHQRIKRGSDLNGHPRCQCQDTKGADRRTEHGAQVANCWKRRAGYSGVCLCLPGLLLPGFRSSCLCRPGELLWCACCAAWLCYRFRCARLRCPLFSLRLTGNVPRTRKIFRQSAGVLYLATQVKIFSERRRKKEVSIYNKIQ